MSKRYLNGIRLKNIIADLNMRLWDFARLVGTHPTYLSRLMTGKVPIGVNLRQRLLDTLSRYRIPTDSLFLPSGLRNSSDSEGERRETITAGSVPVQSNS